MSRDEATPTLGRCGDCGGPIVMKTGPGRAREYLRGLWLAVPDDFGTPACSRCGEEYMTPEVSEPLDELLGKALTALVNQCVAIIQARDHVTQQQIEDAFGVTRSYLSHLRAGRKEPSAPLVKLLELCALSSACFQHLCKPQPFEMPSAERFLVGGRKPLRPGAGFRARRDYAPRYDAPVSGPPDVLYA